MSLRKLREQKGMSQKDLCKVSHINQSTISQYESGTRKPSLKNAKKLANALDSKLDDIFLLFDISI